MPITLPPKPWSIRRENSVNIIIDSVGNNVVMVANAAIAEHIIERCNPTTFYLESDMEEKENEITKLEEDLERTEDDARENHEKLLDKIYSLEDELQQANEQIEEHRKTIEEHRKTIAELETKD